MLPNHSPLSIAEQFGTLATIHGDRIDLGLGRRARRRWRGVPRGCANPRYGRELPQDVLELISYLDDPNPAAAVQAHPGQGTHVPVWMLGSSLFGAQLAAMLGLPYAFASHFAPTALEDALAFYRTRFQPAGRPDAEDGPHFMLAINVIAADTDAEARLLQSSQQLAFARLRSGRPGKLPAPTMDLSEITPPLERMVGEALRISAVGSPATVRAQLSELIQRYQPDGDSDRADSRPRGAPHLVPDRRRGDGEPAKDIRLTRADWPCWPCSETRDPWASTPLRSRDRENGCGPFCRRFDTRSRSGRRPRVTGDPVDLRRWCGRASQRGHPSA